MDVLTTPCRDAGEVDPDAFLIAQGTEDVSAGDFGNHATFRQGLAAVGLAATAFLAAGGAQASDTFDFSFNGDSNNPGLVQGVIYGLPDTGVNQMASSVQITYYPNLIVGLPSVRVTVDNVSQNSFNVQSGSVTYANFYGGFLSAPGGYLRLYSGKPLVSPSQYDLNGISGYVGTNTSPATFTLVSAPVPELPIPLMLSAGMLAPVLARRIRKRRDT